MKAYLWLSTAAYLQVKNKMTLMSLLIFWVCFITGNFKRNICSWQCFCVQQIFHKHIFQHLRLDPVFLFHTRIRIHNDAYTCLNGLQYLFVPYGFMYRCWTRLMCIYMFKFSNEAHKFSICSSSLFSLVCVQCRICPWVAKHPISNSQCSNVLINT